MSPVEISNLGAYKRTHYYAIGHNVKKPLIFQAHTKINVYSDNTLENPRYYR